MKPESVKFAAGVGGMLGLIMALGGLLVMSSNISFPLTAPMIYALLWGLLAGLPALALLAYYSGSTAVPAWAITTALVIGNLVATASLFLAPLLFVFVLVFVLICALVIWQLHGTRLAAIYALVPVLAIVFASVLLRF